MAAFAVPPAITIPVSPTRAHLRPLTSLRFVAASMVVLLHSRVMFPFSTTLGDPINLSDGVTFFFVLSGFILTYAYPSLDERGTRHYFAARFARIWPCHAATLGLMLIPTLIGIHAVPAAHVPLYAVANALMVHSWTPAPAAYFSFNSPSWSISTEWGLYLLFPLLLRNWRRTWWWKLLLGLLTLTLMQRIGQDVFHVPVNTVPRAEMDLTGFAAVNPLANLVQFGCGMAACLLWQRTSRGHARVGIVTATALELAVLGLAIWALVERPMLSAWASQIGTLISSWWWVKWAPPLTISTVVYAGVILVFAVGRGLISQALSYHVPVVLGEISYAVYLIHLPVIILFTFVLRRVTANWPDPLEYAIFCALVLIAAWLLWRFVERPMRRAIRDWYARHEDHLSDRQWRMVGVAIGLVLVCVVTAQWATISGPSPLP
jgi:peptidoglycan/LPS O-acetylase OafA/YrhL